MLQGNQQDNPQVAVTWSWPGGRSRAARLARELHLPLDNTKARSGLQLRVTPQGLELCASSTGVRAICTKVTFTPKQRRFTRPSRELLARAMGRQAAGQKVIDGTGGLGRDAFLLALKGFRVDMVERHPLVAALLEDGLLRAAGDHETAAITSRLSLLKRDFCRIRRVRKWDIVYLDPMFTQKKNSALARKELQLLQMLVRPDQAQEECLLEQGLAIARRRVVVKRAAKGDWLAGRQPAYSLKGSSTRFDIYLVPRERGHRAQVVIPPGHI